VFWTSSSSVGFWVLLPYSLIVKRRDRYREERERETTTQAYSTRRLYNQLLLTIQLIMSSKTPPSITPSPTTPTSPKDADNSHNLTLHDSELTRHFSPLSMLGMAFAILNSWTALAASLSLALPSGGPVAVLWGLVTAGIGNLCLAASLAEFLGVWPTAGGQYEVCRTCCCFSLNTHSRCCEICGSWSSETVGCLDGRGTNVYSGVQYAHQPAIALESPT